MTERPTPSLTEVLQAVHDAAADAPADSGIAADDVGMTALAQEVGEHNRAPATEGGPKPEA